ncbi:MAG: TIGR04255 family protein [Acidimicrobiales bacterium]
MKRARPPSPGPLFALDFDCFWEPPDIPEFKTETVMSTCDELRAPIRALFDMLITEKLLAEFKREVTVI